MSTVKAILAALFAVGYLTDLNAHQTSDFVLMNFTAQWCQPCKEMSKSIDQLSEEGWLIRQIDVDREKTLVQRWQIKQLPTLVILKDGLEVDRVVGKLDYQALTQRLPKLSSANQERSHALSSQIPIDPMPSSTHGIATKSVDAMQTTVRIKIEDGASTSFGSGTIIDQHGDEALVLTCGHLFRDLTPQAQMTVDVPIEGRLVTMPATIVDYRCDEADIGLIAFRPGRPVAVAPLLPRGFALKENDKVCSFGCDHGADPTRRDSHISKLNRYIGPSNVEVAGAPVQGRSGGGLFNEKSQLIGVCYAADAELNEGLFSGPEVVYQQLSRLGLTRLYHAASSSEQVAIGTPKSSAISPASFPNKAIVVSPGNAFPDQAFPDQAMGEGWKSAIGQAAQLTREAASRSIDAVVRNPNGATLTAILRQADGQEQRITIPSPSPALLQALQSQAGSESQMAIR
jgi:thiol-disulfide isomerase/thioredoxin